MTDLNFAVLAPNGLDAVVRTQKHSSRKRLGVIRGIAHKINILIQIYTILTEQSEAEAESEGGLREFKYDVMAT